MTVRNACERDTDKILDLLVQVDMVHHNGRPDLFKGPATKYTREELADIFRNPLTPVFVAVDEEDRVLGYAFCIFQQHKDDHVLTDVKTLYIDDLCVDEAVRGQQVGRTLYHFVVDFARREGCYNLTLNVWSCNPAALRFYEKCGLVPQKIGMETLL